MDNRRNPCNRIFLFTCFLFLAGSNCCAQNGGAMGYEITSSGHSQLKIQQKVVSGNTLSLIYQTLPANQAGANHNTLWLWRATEVPWKYAPVKKQMLPANATQSGSYALDGIDITIGTGYIACYSVDSGVQQICACAHLAAESDSTTSEWVDITLASVLPNSLTFNYATLPGYLPATYSNWFGVWKGQASPYNPFPPLGTGMPGSDANISTGAINNVVLESGQTYTLIYFTGKELSNAAAMITFVVK